MNIIISGIDLKNHWTLTRNEHGKWTAVLADPSDTETGIEFTAYDVDLVIEKLEIFEKGQASYRETLVGAK